MKMPRTLPGLLAVNARTILFLAFGTILLLIYGVVARDAGLFALLSVRTTALWRLSHQELSSMFWKLTLLLPGAVAIAAGLAASGIGPRASRIFAWRGYPAALPAVTFVLLLLSVLFVFRATEVTHDERVYMYQAETLLAGRLWNPPPPVPEVFDNPFILHLPGKTVGKYQPGHPLVLAAGTLLGSPYVLTVLMSTLMIPLVIAISRKLYADRPTALLAGTLLGFSPFFLGMSSSLLSHPTCAFFLALTIFLTLQWTEERPGRMLLARGLAAGLAFGVAFNVRPLTAVAFGAPLGVFVVYRLRSRGTGRGAWIGGFLLGSLSLLALTLLYNRSITGHALLFPYELYDSEDHIGIHTRYLLNPSQLLFTPALNFARLNLILFGMPASLAFAGLYLLRRRPGAADILCYGIVLSVAAAYFFFWSPGFNDLGPAYYYEMTIPLVILSARGMFWLRDVAAARFPSSGTFVSWFCLTSACLAAVFVVPERALYLSRLTAEVEKPYEFIDRSQVHHAVVFLSDVPRTGWILGLRPNDPGKENDVILCSYYPSYVRAVMDAFPGRGYYVLRFSDDRTPMDLERLEPPAP
jgi:hypothetical protein